MADTTKLFLLAGAAGAVWWFYFRTPAPAVPAAVAPPPPNPNVITGANSLDGIYGRLVNAAPAGSLGVDAWNTYLAPLLPSGDVPPDPMALFSAATPGFDRSQPLTIGQYWAVMGPALKTQFGLSGLGVMGSLHAWRGW